MSNAEWKKANIERIAFLVSKPLKPIIQERAKSLGKSANQYILECIQDDMVENNWSERILNNHDD